MIVVIYIIIIAVIGQQVYKGTIGRSLGRTYRTGMEAVDVVAESHETAATRRPPTGGLDFNEAMTDFKTMFPTLDEEVIEAVLRCNKGSVDRTVDQLLTMSCECRAADLIIGPTDSGGLPVQHAVFDPM